jgi:hypothetical protein
MFIAVPFIVRGENCPLIDDWKKIQGNIQPVKRNFVICSNMGEL